MHKPIPVCKKKQAVQNDRLPRRIALCQVIWVCWKYVAFKAWHTSIVCIPHLLPFQWPRVNSRKMITKNQSCSQQHTFHLKSTFAFIKHPCLRMEINLDKKGLMTVTKRLRTLKFWCRHLQSASHVEILNVQHPALKQISHLQKPLHSKHNFEFKALHSTLIGLMPSHFALSPL